VGVCVLLISWFLVVIVVVMWFLMMFGGMCGRIGGVNLLIVCVIVFVDELVCYGVCEVVLCLGLCFVPFVFVLYVVDVGGWLWLYVCIDEWVVVFLVLGLVKVGDVFVLVVMMLGIVVVNLYLVVFEVLYVGVLLLLLMVDCLFELCGIGVN